QGAEADLQPLRSLQGRWTGRTAAAGFGLGGGHQGRSVGGGADVGTERTSAVTRRRVVWNLRAWGPRAAEGVTGGGLIRARGGEGIWLRNALVKPQTNARDRL